MSRFLEFTQACFLNSKVVIIFQFSWRANIASIYLFKVNIRNTRTRYDICSKLTIKTPEQRHWSRSVVIIITFEHMLYLVPVFLLLNLNMQLSAGNVFLT